MAWTKGPNDHSLVLDRVGRLQENVIVVQSAIRDIWENIRLLEEYLDVEVVKQPSKKLVKRGSKK